MQKEYSSFFQAKLLFFILFFSFVKLIYTQIDMSDNTELSNQEVDEKQRKINERKQKLFNLKLKMNAGIAIY